MSGERTVYVKVTKIFTEWVEVSAGTLAEAVEKAEKLPNVYRAIAVDYDRPTDA